MPQRDLFIEKDSSINEHIEQMRLSATKSLLERRDVVIVATVSAIYGIGNPSDYHQMVMTVRKGDKMGQRDVIAQLIRMQYTRNEMEFSRGTFRVRGDTIDVFPAEHSELAIRIELFDDELESIQLFDPLTGRVKQKTAYEIGVRLVGSEMCIRDSICSMCSLIELSFSMNRSRCGT